MKKQLLFLNLVLGIAPFFMASSLGQVPDTTNINSCYPGELQQNRQLSVIQGNTLPVAFGINSENDMQVSFYEYPEWSEVWADTAFIPDGPACPSVFLSVPVIFACFPPNTGINSENDILSVCVNMEHSFSADIKIEISCPNGQTAILKSYGSPEGNIYMGNANDADGYGCNGVPGTGWNYCWTNNSDYAQINPYSFGSQTTSYGSFSIIDSSNKEEHTNYYIPLQSFNNLTGCPLNGAWTLKVTDVYGGDNGFLFNWDIQFAEGFRSPPDTVVLDSVRVAYYDTGTVMDTVFSGNIVTLVPQNIGNLIYYTTAYTDSGCVYYGEMAVEVLPDTVSAIPNLQPQTANWNVALYPNPAQGNTNLILDKPIENAKVCIFNMLGQLIYQSPIMDKTTALPTAEYPFGVYAVKISDKNGITKTVKLLKQ